MLLTKLTERPPIIYNLVRNAASPSTINIVKNAEEYVIRFFIIVMRNGNSLETQAISYCFTCSS